jgi:hypothetical protein
MLLMSGGRAPPAAPAANGAADESIGGAAAPSLDDRPKRCPATSATSATSAIAATLHGSALENPRCSVALTVPPVPAAAPAGVPHRWQNFAPGVSGAPHDAQAEPANGAPQLEQNFPVDSTPHAEHFCGVPEAVWGEAMQESYMPDSVHA